MVVAVSMQASLQYGLYWNQGRVKGLRKNLNKRSQLCLLGSTSLRNMNKRSQLCLLGSTSLRSMNKGSQLCSLGSTSLQRNLKTSGPLYLLGANLSSPLQNLKTRDLFSSVSSENYSWNTNISKRFVKRADNFSCKSQVFKCKCSLNLGLGLETSVLKNIALYLAWLCKNWQGNPAMVRLAPTVGILIFTIWGLGPVVNHSMNICRNKSNSSGKKSIKHNVTTMHDQHLFYWAGAVIVCRALQPMVPPTEFGQLVIDLLDFVGAFSATKTLFKCMSSSIEREVQELVETKLMGFGYVDKALSIVVAVTSLALYLELLGFSTPKLAIARMLVLTLFLFAGCEIFKNTLPSSIICATRPFDVNIGIQTSIEEYDVYGTTEMGSIFDGRVVFIGGLCAVMMFVIQLLDSSIVEWFTAGMNLFIVIKIVGPELFNVSHQSSMIHATRQFVVTEGIQANIDEGYDVSGTVEICSRFDGRIVFVVVLGSVVAFFIPLLVSSEWLITGVRALIIFMVYQFEILTYSLPSSMIHATRKFVVNEGIQTNIEGHGISETAKNNQNLQQTKVDVATLNKEDGTAAIRNPSTVAEGASLVRLISLGGILNQLKDELRQTSDNVLGEAKKKSLLGSIDELMELVSSLLDHQYAQSHVTKLD